MEKTARRQQIIKWQVVLGAVVCAIIAFCALSGGVIAASAAEPVTYIDRTWDEKTKNVKEETKTCTEYKVLDKEQCDKDLDSGWYVLNSSFTYKKHVNINENQDVNIILKDGCTLTATKKGFSVKDGATLTIYGQSKGTGKLDLDGNSGDAGLRVGPTSILNIKGGTIRAEGTSGGAGIGGDRGEAAGLINIYGGNVTADSGKKAYGIGGEGGGCVNIYGGKVEAIGDGKDYDIGDKSVSVFVSEKAELTGTYMLPEKKTVEYVDRVWNAENGKVEEITTVTDENGKSLPLTHECIALNEDYQFLYSGWYVIDSTFTNKERIIIPKGQDVKIIAVDDCTVTATNGFSVRDGATLTIYGQDAGTGKLVLDASSGDAGIRVPEGATLNIKGGIIKASGTKGGAGIGGDKYESAGTVTMWGGKVTATGGKGAAGIGGGTGENGTLTVTTVFNQKPDKGSGSPGGNGGTTIVYGGEVEAIGNDGGAGIGGGEGGAAATNMGILVADSIMLRGGNGGSGGTTIIYGGKVTAKGRNSGDGNEGGAGIGGGEGGYGGTAFSLCVSVGEECGAGGAGGTIIIHGGDVTAEGGDFSAGIGGGKSGLGTTAIALLSAITDNYMAKGGDGGDIIIDGGTVHATGGNGSAITDGAPGIGGGCGGYSGASVAIVPISLDGAKGGDGGNVSITGGQLTIEGRGGAPDIGGGSGGDSGAIGDDAPRGAAAAVNITGGNFVDCDNIQGYNVPLKTFTLEGVKEEVEVVGINCNYGIKDVKTTDTNKLKFYISENENKKLSEITVEDGEMIVFSRENDSDKFVLKPFAIDIKGVTAQNEAYDGFPKQGYTGTPENGYGYYEEYTTTYYLSTGERTTHENSGATGEGKAPVYVGDYIVRITVPIEESLYFGYTDLAFKIEKATPEIVEPPTLSGVYGTAVKDMKLTAGVAKVEDMEVEGIWAVTDSHSSMIPYVGTEEDYEVTFTPNDTRNCNLVTTMVTPEVEKATPEIVEEPTLSGSYGTAVKDMTFTGGLVTFGNMGEPGIWEVTDERGTDIPEVGTKEAYEVTFTPVDTRNYHSVATAVVPKVIEIPTLAEPTLTSTSDKNNQKLIYKLKEKLSNSEVKAKLSDSKFRNKVKEKILNSELIKDVEAKAKLKNLLSINPELKGKVKDKITTSELIEDEEVREKLLSFIEE